MTAQEPLTPLDVETKQRQLLNELTRAEIALAQARDLEVDAKHAFERGRRRAILSEKSPKVTRGGYTTAERDAWVDEQVSDLQFDYDRAAVATEAARTHLRVLFAQCDLVRSLGAGVRTAYQMPAA
jgi:hypothetical protein